MGYRIPKKQGRGCLAIGSGERDLLAEVHGGALGLGLQLGLLRESAEGFFRERGGSRFQTTASGLAAWHAKGYLPGKVFNAFRDSSICQQDGKG